MITGIGCDIVQISRIKNILSKPRTINKIFAKQEIDYCQQFKKCEERYAGRFAAKEALLKALGKGLLADIKLKEIIVENNEIGKPFFRFQDKRKIEQLDKVNIELSISHEKDYAIAFVIIEKIK